MYLLQIFGMLILTLPKTSIQQPQFLIYPNYYYPYFYPWNYGQHSYSRNINQIVTPNIGQNTLKNFPNGGYKVRESQNDFNNKPEGLSYVYSYSSDNGGKLEKSDSLGNINGMFFYTDDAGYHDLSYNANDQRVFQVIGGNLAPPTVAHDQTNLRTLNEQITEKSDVSSKLGGSFDEKKIPEDINNPLDNHATDLTGVSGLMTISADTPTQGPLAINLTPTSDDTLTSATLDPATPLDYTTYTHKKKRSKLYSHDDVRVVFLDEKKVANYGKTSHFPAATTAIVKNQLNA